MDQVRTGKLIRTLRLKHNMTQLALADRIGVSDKAVSKWERGCGAPEISILPVLAEALQVDTEALLRGDMKENDPSSGNMNKLDFYYCPECGNLVYATDAADISCCGKKLMPLQAKRAEKEEQLQVSIADGEWYITSAHEMWRGHYISFLAFLTGDTVIVKKLYPEWGLEARIPFFAHGTLFWYCTQDGLFWQEV